MSYPMNSALMSTTNLPGVAINPDTSFKHPLDPLTSDEVRIPSSLTLIFTSSPDWTNVPVPLAAYG